jgi:hypothetical protein
MAGRTLNSLTSIFDARRKSATLIAALLTILMLGFTLRVYGLSYEEVEGDEAFSYIFSIDTLDGIVHTTLTNGEPHPVASYFLDHFWLQLAGHSEFAFRFPSVWFGVLSVAVIYRLSRRLHLSVGQARDAVPILAALLIALSPFLVQESRNGRMYSMSLCLSMISAWLTLELINAPPGTPGSESKGLSRLLRTWLPKRALVCLVAYILVSWIALNVHYFTGTILLAENVFVLIVLLTKSLRRQVHVLVRWVIAELVVLAAFAPWYLLVRNILNHYQGVGRFANTLLEVLQAIAGAFAVGQQSSAIINVFTFIALGATLFGFVRLVISGVQQRRAAIYLLLLILVPSTLAWLDARSRSTFTERQIVGTATGFIMLMAMGIAFTWDGIHSQWRTKAHTVICAALVIIICAGSVIGLHNYYTWIFNAPRSWHEFTQLVQRYSANVPRAQLRVAQNYPDPGLTFYYDKWPWAITLPAKQNDMNGAKEAVHGLATAGVQRVIVRMDPLSWWNGEPEQNVAKTSLATEYKEVYEKFTGRWIIAVYSRIDPGSLKPVGISFEDRVKLEAAAIRGLSDMHTSTPEKYLEVYLRWQDNPAKLNGSEKLFIHILDQNGQVPSQLDVPFTAQDAQAAMKTYSVPIADTLPAGVYRVRVGIYDPTLPGAPRLKTSDQSDGVDIGTLTIEQ